VTGMWWQRLLNTSIALFLVHLLAHTVPVIGFAVADPAQNGGDPLIAGKAALEDGLCELAENEFREYLKTKEQGTDDVGEVLILLAECLYEQGKHDDVLDLLKQGKGWTAGTVENGGFVFWRAIARYGLNRYSSALVELEDFETRFSGSGYVGRARRLRAWCYLESGKTDEALETFELFGREHSDSPEAAANLLQWARTLVGADRSDEAVEVLKRLIKLPARLPEVQDGARFLGGLQLEAGKWQEAVTVLTGLAANTSAPDDMRAEAWFLVADAEQELENAEAAEKALRSGVKLAKDADLKRRGEFDIGLMLLDSGRLDEGIPLLKSYISAMPDNPISDSTQLRLAECLLKNEKYGQALDEFQYYLETFAESAGQAQASYGKGWALMNISRHAEAATAFSKAYTLFENEEKKAICLFKVADAYFANGQYRLAMTNYERVLSEFPGTELTRKAVFQLAESTARSGQAEAAEKKFLELIDQYPGTERAEEAQLRIAELMQGQDRLQEAIDGFDKVMNLYSNGVFFADALHGRGMVRYRLALWGEALEDFEKVVAEFSDSSAAEQAYYMRGMCHYWFGRNEKALAISSDFIEKYTNSPWAADVLFWKGRYRYNRSDFEAAEKEFLLLCDKYPTDSLADDALFRAGKSAFKRKDYVHAVELFTRLAKEYPPSKHMAEARFAQADAHCEINKPSEAILILDEIINKYPGSDLIPAAWGRKGDCQFILGTDDPKRYEQAIESYRVVANNSEAARHPVLQAECKIGRCLDKLGRTTEALEQYYKRVILPYMADRSKGVYHPEAEVWFVRAVWRAVSILEEKEDWGSAVSILERLVEADVPASKMAEERIRELKAAHWWLFGR
jgi:TolA-binding protein